MPPSAVSRAWEAVEASLDAATKRALRPPVTAAVLAKATATLGRLPAELRASLARHDGMRESPLFLNVRLLPLGEIVKTWKMRLESAASVPYRWSRDWLPITDADGDHLCLDRATGRIVAFTNAGARARVVAPSLPTWLARVPRYVRAERDEDRRRAAALPEPTGTTKRARERQAKIDGELAYFVGFIEHEQRIWKGTAPAKRALDYRAISRGVRAAEVLARSLELGHVREVDGGVRVTAKGRRFRAR